jgi:hypothetical protein
VRKTYYRYKEKAIAVSEIEQLEDMVKLKNAKTSTRERLAKTIRKYSFLHADSTSKSATTRN